jgi:hypothetical protein
MQNNLNPFSESRKPPAGSRGGAGKQKPRPGKAGLLNQSGSYLAGVLAEESLLFEESDLLFDFL